MTASATWWWLLATLCTALAAQTPTLTVDTKRQSHVISDRFLSVTIDPTLLMDGEYAPGLTKIMALARGLAPAYVRLGSSASNRYQFLKAGSHWPINASYTVTEAQWMIVNDFAQKSGLEPIVCVNVLSRRDGSGHWDTTNLRNLVAYSDKRRYRLSWQLGYELQHLKDRFSGQELGNNLRTVRRILDAYPRYKQSRLLGPDIILTDDSRDEKFLKEFLSSAGESLSAVTWHAFENLNETRFDRETNVLAAQKKVLVKKLGEDFARKPLWIAESYRDPGHPCRYEDGLTWAMKLGEAAKLGVQVVMQRPQVFNLQTPTPDYWVSFLHKTLVGNIVLDNSWMSSAGEVSMYSHCSNSQRLSTNLFVNDQLRYEPGSMTVFGVNWRPEETNITLRMTAPSKGTRDVELHEYIITEDESRSPLDFLSPAVKHIPQVYLNGRALSLDLTGRLPILTPNVRHYSSKMMLTLPGKSVGFWVLSGAKVRACLDKDGEYQEKVSAEMRSRREVVGRGKRSVESGSEDKEFDENVQKENVEIQYHSQSDQNASTNQEEGIGKHHQSKSKQITKKSIADSKAKKVDDLESDIKTGKNQKKMFQNENKPTVNTLSAGFSTKEMPMKQEMTTNYKHNNGHVGIFGVKNNEDSSPVELEVGDKDEKTKYRISKVLVVFENNSENPSVESGETETKKETNLEDEMIGANEQETLRFSRGLETDAFRVPPLTLSLLDIAALREPLVSLKRLREKRWEELQQKKLLAGEEYKRALGLQASMLFPKKLISGIPKLNLLPSLRHSTEESGSGYDYVNDDDIPTPHHSEQHVGQWHLRDGYQEDDMMNKRNTAHPRKEIWEVDQTPIGNGKDTQPRGNQGTSQLYGPRGGVPKLNSNVEQNYRKLQTYATVDDDNNGRFQGELQTPTRQSGFNGEAYQQTGRNFNDRDIYNLHEGFTDITSLKRKRRTDDRVTSDDLSKPMTLHPSYDRDQYDKDNKEEDVNTFESEKRIRDRRHLTESGGGVSLMDEDKIQSLDTPSNDQLKGVEEEREKEIHDFHLAKTNEAEDDSVVDKWETHYALRRDSQLQSEHSTAPVQDQAGSLDVPKGEQSSPPKESHTNSNERNVRNSVTDVHEKPLENVKDDIHDATKYKIANVELMKYSLLPLLSRLPVLPKYSPLPKFDNKLLPVFGKLPVFAVPTLIKPHEISLKPPVFAIPKHEVVPGKSFLPVLPPLVPLGILRKSVIDMNKLPKLLDQTKLIDIPTALQLQNFASDLKFKSNKALDNLGKNQLVSLTPAGLLVPLQLSSFSHFQDDLRTQGEILRAKLEDIKGNAEDRLYFKTPDTYKIDETIKESLYKTADLTNDLQKSLKYNQEKVEEQLSNLVGVISDPLVAVEHAKIGRSIESRSYSEHMHDKSTQNVAKMASESSASSENWRHDQQTEKDTKLEKLGQSEQIKISKELYDNEQPAGGHSELVANIAEDQFSQLHSAVHPEEFGRFKREATYKDNIQFLKNNKTPNKKNSIHQHSKKRFLKSKELRFLYSSKNERNPKPQTQLKNCNNKSDPRTDSEVSASPDPSSQWPTQDSSCHLDPEQAVNVDSDNSNQPLSHDPTNQDHQRTEFSNYKTGNTDAVSGPTSIDNVNNKRCSFSDNDCHSYDEVENISSDISGNHNGKSESRYWHFKSVQFNNKNDVKEKLNDEYILKQDTKNKLYERNRLKRYVHVINSRGESNELLDNKLRITHYGEGLSEEALKEKSRVLEEVLDIIKEQNINDVLKNHQNLNNNHVRNKQEEEDSDIFDIDIESSNSIIGPFHKKTGDVQHIVKDWNFNLSPQGLTILSEQTQDTQALRNNIDKIFGWKRRNTENIDKQEQQDSDTASNKTEINEEIFNPKQPKGKNTRATEINNEKIITNIEKIGFFSNILKNIFYFFHSMFNKS